MAQNLTCRLPFAGAGRQAEVSGADWTTGMNPGGCAPVIGLTTAVYGTNSSTDVVDPVQSQRIGTAAEDVVEPVDGNDTFAYAAADSNTVADAVFDAATGAVNRSGATLPSGEFIHGTVPVA